MKIQFDSQLLEKHKDKTDRFLQCLKESRLTDEEIEVYLAALLLALTTSYPKKWKEKARQLAKDTMQGVLPTRRVKCVKCNLVGHFDVNRPNTDSD